MNQVAQVGNITDDPDLRYTQSGAATGIGWIETRDRFIIVADRS
jgi:single-stranded DNA-binding protein